MKILDYALALDGGTQVITLKNNEGEQISIGLDGRMDSPLSGKQLFLGNSPDGPETKLLEIGGAEELEVITLLESWLDQTQGFLRREALMESDSASLKGQDILDREGLEFLLKINQRDVPWQAHVDGRITHFAGVFSITDACWAQSGFSKRP